MNLILFYSISPDRGGADLIFDGHSQIFLFLCAIDSGNSGSFSSYFTGAAAALALKVTALRISEAAARTANLFRKCGQGFIFFPPVLHDAIN